MHSFDLGRALLEPTARRAARAAGDLLAALRAGVTSIRDAGGFALDIAPAVRDDTIAGPSIHAAGSILSTTGGHGDLHDLPLDWVHDLTRNEGMLRLCDGVDGCTVAVREQLRNDAAIIKICASGGVLSEIDDPIHQQFTDAELRGDGRARRHAGPDPHDRDRPGSDSRHHGPGSCRSATTRTCSSWTGTPTSDLAVLADPARIAGVFQGGRLVAGSTALAV